MLCYKVRKLAKEIDQVEVTQEFTYACHFEVDIVVRY